MFVWLHTSRSKFLWGLTRSVSCFASTSDLKPWPRMTLESYIFTKYLSVLFELMYLNDLHVYGECNRTARACVNSGYQALFSPNYSGLQCSCNELISKQMSSRDADQSE